MYPFLFVPSFLNDRYSNERVAIIHHNYLFTGVTCEILDMNDAKAVASFIKDNDVSIEAWDRAVLAKDSKKGELINETLSQVIVDEVNLFAKQYFKVVRQKDTAMRQVILDMACPVEAMEYMKLMGHDDAMRQVVVDANPSIIRSYEASVYCKLFGKDKEMYQIALQCCAPETALLYCRYVEDDINMRQMILNSDSEDYFYIIDYCRWVSDDADMRQALMSHNDIDMLIEYTNIVGNKNKDMLDHVINNADAEDLYKYYSEADADDAVYAALLNTGDEYYIEKASRVSTSV